MIPTFLRQFWQSLPPRLAVAVGHACSLVIGLLIAVMLHYLLYRISLPGTPFIYVVF
jgi:hypothetical protein